MCGEFSSAKTVVASNYDPFSIGDVPLKQVHVPEYVHLGIWIRPKLDFSTHFQTIQGRFVQRVNLLCYMGHCLPATTIMLLYKSYVHPSIEYAIPVWWPRTGSTQLAALGVLQAKVRGTTCTEKAKRI